jgi:hypothetical protein
MNIRSEKEAKSMLVTEIASWRKELIEKGREEERSLRICAMICPGKHTVAMG